MAVPFRRSTPSPPPNTLVTLIPGAPVLTLAAQRHAQVIVLGANTLARLVVVSRGGSDAVGASESLAVLDPTLGFLPPSAVLYQLEHIMPVLGSSQWMTQHYMDVLHAFDVWDYTWCVPVSGCVWLCLAVSGCVWLCLAVSSCVWLCCNQLVVACHVLG